MAKIEIVEGVERERPAFVLAAQSADGTREVKEVSWAELVSAQPGKTWEVSGGGMYYSEEHVATVIFNDGGNIAVLFTSENEVNGEKREDKYLRCFSRV